jgi:hypothetical protein
MIRLAFRACSFRFDQPPPAATNLTASARGGSRGTWALDADRLGNHALMMQRRSYRRKEACRPGREETPSTDAPVDLTSGETIFVKREREKQRAHCTRRTSAEFASRPHFSGLLENEQLLDRLGSLGVRKQDFEPGQPCRITHKRDRSQLATMLIQSS